MDSLDLHGTRHTAAEEKIRKFLNFTELPCEIITGQSREMKNIVKKVATEYGWSSREKDSYNPGALIISEGR
jgi:hypothetical protein